MSRTAIMTDSNCGFMPDEGDQLGIHILSMPVLIDGKTYYEGKDISPELFFQRLSDGAAVSTSQPSPGEVIELWKRLLQNYEEIVYIPMSSGLSNTCQTAAILAQDSEFSGRVFVVDNHRISVTQAQSALDAKVMADSGMSGQKIKETLEQEALDASIYIAVDTLEYLKRGGRITGAAAAIGTVLNLKPVLTIQGDKLDACTKTRGMKAAFKAMCKELQKDLDTRLVDLYQSGRLKAGIASAAVPEDKLSYFRQELMQQFPDLELFELPLTTSIGCHTGPGALGIGVVRKL